MNDTTTLPEYARMQNLAAELRCLVCQNQNIADSNAGLAVDLRKQIIEQIHDGKSNADIKQYMVERYGEFILYDPPFNMSNATLWLAPFLLLLLGIWLTIRRIQKNQVQSPFLSQIDNLIPIDPKRASAIEQRYQENI